MRAASIRLLCAIVLLAIAPVASAQYPSKPIRIVVPYPPGGGIDALARSMQAPLGKALGQPVIVDNKSGAAGMVGIQEVLRASPDGYNLVVINNGNVITPLLQEKPSFDPLKDLTPVSLLSDSPLVLYTHPSIAANDVRSFIAYARTQPQGLFFSSTGTGGIGHLSVELFARSAGLKLNHVPYKGLAPAITAVLAGEVQMVITAVSDTTLQMVKAGKLKALGVTTAKPSPLVPGVPPIGETLPNYAVPIWYGLVAPVGTAPDVALALNRAIAMTVAQPDIEKRFAVLSFTPLGGSPKQFADVIAKEVADWRGVIQAANIHIE